MAIRVARNAAGNCVVFYGQTNPVYFNACLSAEIDGDNISIRNDIASVIDENGGGDEYEFYQIPYTEFRDADNASFESAQAAADYINSIGNVTDVPTSGQSFAPGETINFYRDETSTSILFSNGDHHGVNSIKATVKDNGRVGILTVNADVELYEYDYNDMLINGASAGGNAQTVVNNLNALFTVSVAPSPVPTPVYLTEDGVDVAWNSRETFDPVGDDLFGAQSSSYHGARVWTTETINEPGEFFEFTFKNTVSGGGALIGIGLYDAGSESNDLSEILNDNLSNSGHHGFWFSNWFYNYSGYTAPWTTYGSNSGLVYGPGWNGAANKQFRYSEVHDQMRDLGGDVRMKCGITDDGFVGIWYFDAELANYGDPNTNRSSEWILCARSGTPVPEGQYGLLVKLASTSARITSLPRRFASDPAAPTLYYRYIESPDGTFIYPLFSSAEEANYVDLQNGGTGTSGTRTYVDDSSGTTWYIPDTGATEDGTSAPTGSEYTAIPSGVDADFVPPVFTQADLTQEEGTNVNLGIQPADATWTSAVDISPAGSGLVYSSGTGLLQGTLSDVGADTVYTVTVTRANAYGSSVGSFTITATDVAPVSTNDTNWTKALDFSGSAERAQQVDNSYYRVPMKMAGTNNQVAAPTAGQTVASGHPWATTVVFKADTTNSNQHVWNMGEGAGSADDNIYLRRDANRNIYFGWGRDGDRAECFVGSVASNIGGWYGVYVGFNGTRLGSGQTAADMAACFDIRFASASNSWAVGSNLSTSSNWDGACRMNRAYSGYMTIGGRGSNRSFHGKVASFVTTTLRCGQAMPTDTEIKEMITDPQGWIDDYKVGNQFRLPWQTGNSGFNFNRNDGSSGYATQVWLMGDGTYDSYSNMIRNQVKPDDQNYTKLNLISMQSNDIQTVNIPGLSG